MRLMHSQVGNDLVWFIFDSNGRGFINILPLVSLVAPTRRCTLYIRLVS